MDLTRLTRVDTTTWRIEPHGGMRLVRFGLENHDFIAALLPDRFQEARQPHWATFQFCVLVSAALASSHPPLGGSRTPTRHPR